METTESIKFQLPYMEYEAFNKFVAKSKKHLPELVVTFGEPYDELFNHGMRDFEGVVGMTKEWHKVVDVEVVLPTDNDWKLLVSYEKGLTFISDPSRELILKNNQHGESYKHCDVCGHSCQNSYVILNVKTGEELQVGCECAKKFGLNMIRHIMEFTVELRRIYDFYLPCCTEDEPIWRGGKDKFAFSAVKSSDLIKSAKAYYNEQKDWKKGYYEGISYIHSSSNIDIQNNVANKVFDGTDEYIKEVCDYAKKQLSDSDSEFSISILKLANSFYTKPACAPEAYFMVKMYEEYLDKKRLNLIELQTGQQVLVDGEIIDTYSFETMYGWSTQYTILTTKGYKVKRTGVIPIKEDGDKERTTFYALVKFVGKDIVLDRATKHPKKGIEVITL